MRGGRDSNSTIQPIFRPLLDPGICTTISTGSKHLFINRDFSQFYKTLGSCDGLADEKLLFSDYRTFRNYARRLGYL